MGYSPESDYYRSPGGAVSVKNIRSKIIELKEYIAHCESDERAVNAWREICKYDLALMMDAEQQGKIPTVNDGGTDWPTLVKRLKKEWDELKTSEKTEVKTNREGQFVTMSIQWDSYVGEVPPELFDNGVALMEKEKFSSVNHRLMQWSGWAEAVLFSSGVFLIDDKIEIPEKPVNVYTDEQMAQDISGRRMPKRRNDQRQPR